MHVLSGRQQHRNLGHWSLHRCRSAWCTALSFGTRSVAMPKEKRAQQQKNPHYSSHVQILHVDNSTASPSVLLVFDQQRYLFNVGEGFQRHCFEYKLKLNKVQNFLATRVSTETLAGLPGSLLSQVLIGYDGTEDNAVKAALYGPAGVNRYKAAFSHYASSFNLQVHEIGASRDKPIIHNDYVRITPVPIQPAIHGSEFLQAIGNAANTHATAAHDSTQPAAKKQKTEHNGATATAAQSAAGNAAKAAAALEQLYEPAAPAANGASQPNAGTPGQSSSGMYGCGMSELAPLVICYVCQLASIPGKFNPRKAAQLGLPAGPAYGQLQRGESVTAPDGRIITPADVMESPDMAPACLVILDCPSNAYLPSLAAAPALQQLQQQASQQAVPVAARGAATGAAAAANGSNNGNIIGSSGSSSSSNPTKRWVFCHLGPMSVVSSSAYHDWLTGFGPAAEHLMASSYGHTSITTQQAATLQAQLNFIEPQVFSIQGFMSLAQQQTADLQQQQLQVTHAANGCRFILAPFRYQGLAIGGVSSVLDMAAVQEAVRSKAAVMQLLEQYQAAKAAVQQEPLPARLQGISRTTCELTILGTSSATPSNHRNVSAYYLDLFDRGGLLMDCGEDTMGQLERRYGRQDAARRIRQLQAVWVSHMHADHHGGLYPLLLYRQHLLQQQAAGGADGAVAPPAAAPLFILGPWPLFKVLQDYRKVLPLQFHFLPNTHFYDPAPHPPPAAVQTLYEAVKHATGLKVLQPFPVQHIAHSSGLQLESSDGWKIVFSGDTRPCQSVIDAAKGATLLVHEATFENGLQGEAVTKKHSTTAEALGVAAAAGAYRTVLTHFSCRYPKIPVIKSQGAAPVGQAVARGNSNGQAQTAGTDSACSTDQNSDLEAAESVIVGFDLMTVNLADLPWLPKLLPVLDELCKEEEQVYQQDHETSNIH